MKTYKQINIQIIANYQTITMNTTSSAGTVLYMIYGGKQWWYAFNTP